MGSRSSYLRRFLRGLGQLGARGVNDPAVYAQDGGYQPLDNVAPVGSGGSIYQNYAEPLSFDMHITPEHAPIGTGGSASTGAYGGYDPTLNFGPAIQHMVAPGRHPGNVAGLGGEPYYLAQPSPDHAYESIRYASGQLPQSGGYVPNVDYYGAPPRATGMPLHFSEPRMRGLGAADGGYTPAIDYGAPMQSGTDGGILPQDVPGPPGKIAVTTEGQGGPLDFFKGTFFGIPRWAVLGVGAAVAWKLAKGGR